MKSVRNHKALVAFLAQPLNCPHLKGSNVNDIQRQWFTEGTPEKDWLQYMAHGRQ